MKFAINKSEAISFRAQCLFYALAWSVALAILAIPTFHLAGLSGWLWLGFFPAGLFGFMLSPSSYQKILRSLLSSPVVIGWMLYAVLTALALFQNRRSRFWILYGILCALLALNVAGCYHRFGAVVTF